MSWDIQRNYNVSRYHVTDHMVSPDHTVEVWRVLLSVVWHESFNG